MQNQHEQFTHLQQQLTAKEADCIKAAQFGQALLEQIKLVSNSYYFLSSIKRFQNMKKITNKRN